MGLKRRPRTAPILTHLRKSICKFSGNRPYVCCPELKPFKPTTPKPEPTTELPEVIELPNVDVCGKSNITIPLRIVGGVNSTLHAWPWIAALGFKDARTNETRYSCGGSLITKRHVLTAAHCAVEKNLFTVRLGEHELYNDTDGATPVDIRVANKIIHKGYDRKKLTDDIAILRLERDVETFDTKIGPVCLPTPELGDKNEGEGEEEETFAKVGPVSAPINERTFVDTQPFVAGWGTIAYRGPQSNRLLETSLTVTTEEECRTKFERVQQDEKIDGNKICAVDRSGVSDACQGDSGGPLMFPAGVPGDSSTLAYQGPDGKLRWVQIGIVSFGFRCGIKGFPGVYTRVTKYTDWIKNNLN